MGPFLSLLFFIIFFSAADAFPLFLLLESAQQQMLYVRLFTLIFFVHCIIILFCFFSLEKLVTFFLPPCIKTPQALQRTFAYVCLDLKILSGCQFRVLNDAASYWIPSRSLGGKGKLYVSRGLIEGATEEQIRLIFSRGIQSLGLKGIVLKTFGFVILQFILRCLPKSWTPAWRSNAGGGVFFSIRAGVTPLQAYVFILVYPFLDYLLKESVLPVSGETEFFRSGSSA